MDAVSIYEVGPRDGLQNEPRPASAAQKVAYIEALADAGLQRIEATSFVRAGVIPQLSDADEVYRALRPRTDVRYIALTPNRKGMDNAIACGLQEAAIFTAASQTFTRKNINASIEESIHRFREVAALAEERRIPLRAYVSTVVECPYEGRVPPEATADVCARLFDLGAYQISLGETIGVAAPDEIARLLETLLRRWPAENFAGHFHDTRGTALANVFRSLDFGLRAFDASSGGLGGCPYAPGAAGNLATEDLVYALERSGYQTGVNLEKLSDATTLICAALQRSPASRVYQALRKQKDASPSSS
ncbi:MAG: hydroxymethylglutaryl-CoA lyase [Leptospirales bacterium]|nr:hydroxymethylglutaryl-CoA lyase [Leptospirales bacterium]